MMTKITAERLRYILKYNPETGVWVWINPTGNRVKVGQIAGRKGGTGHWQIGIDGRRYPSARLAVLYMTGIWPDRLVDHVDMNLDNERWSNLREASKSQNGANRKKNKNNTSGIKGVTWAKRERKWVAQIEVESRHIHLGCFSDKGKAGEAYIAAAQKYFGEFART